MRNNENKDKTFLYKRGTVGLTGRRKDFIFQIEDFIWGHLNRNNIRYTSNFKFYIRCLKKLFQQVIDISYSLIHTNFFDVVCFYTF